MFTSTVDIKQVLSLIQKKFKNLYKIIHNRDSKNINTEQTAVKSLKMRKSLIGLSATNGSEFSDQKGKTVIIRVVNNAAC